MKRLVIALLFCWSAAPSLFADGGLTEIDAPFNAPRTATEVMQRIRAAHVVRSQAMQPRRHVIEFDLSESEFLIPIAGNTAASGGTYFRSDVTFANLRNAKQNFGVLYLQAGQDNSSAAPKFYSLDAGAIVTVTDFVGTNLQKGGIGSLLVFGTDEQGSRDVNAELDGFSRIWTPQPGSSGAVSQNFDAISTLDLIGNGITYILGLRQNAQFHSNVGIVNLDSSAHNFNVTSLVTGASETITVPAMSVVQTGIPANSGGSSSGSVQLGLTTDSTDVWSAYGTSNDNTTGDGWVSRAKRFTPQ
ncbi:MAG: hypothetical protein ACXV7D_06225 [Thermoanaerobaculia bacterium]